MRTVVKCEELNTQGGCSDNWGKDSVLDPHWFQCLAGSSILGQCGGFRLRIQGFDD